MEEGAERRKAMMKTSQKEQERERRRIRDRQRRQSMSVEEREKHLARRRRNYQLRRLRADNNPRLHHHPPFHHQTTTTTSAAANVDVTLPSVGLEIPADKLAKLPTRRVRLNHLKHLARSLDNHDHVGVPINHTIAAPDLTNDQTANANSTCVTAKGGLRLNRVKRLARSLASDLENSTREKFSLSC
ncbi:uncharacterized protein LOC8273264 isoform X2 [Ricinus communis]|uniref:uncharacterized protein LOC8273264 isoform X2 n=1 Tax=Ricinus communis TaxID=3988 RepID=UPI000D68C6D9|nr:uncharacterized protein LOC8273264 isoform X2 [Ricinus communis]XP_048236104.1 uncharacterized protein LOC8273264 isoform X2 [Ricinus communis]|eukprot:XP_025015726.1 uncharacterized protein LOC8273264 isoform X2 [Ricinus communis]